MCTVDRLHGAQDHKNLEPYELLISNIWAYLLIIRSRENYVVHQDWQKFLYSIDASGESSVLSRIVYRLSGALGLFCPLADYGIYNV